MRTIERTSQFKKDYKRESKGQHRLTVESDLITVLKQLMADKPLATKYRDHPLSNNWADHRDCHIRPDLVLIYRLPDDDTLQLVRLGSHSELGI
jgi:mRNA interferase YafQ